MIESFKNAATAKLYQEGKATGLRGVDVELALVAAINCLLIDPA